MLVYQRFFHDHGCRLPQHLNNPIINLDLATLVLPQSSIFNYLPEDSVNKGITPDHWAIKNSERLVMVEHITQLSSEATEGSPRRNQISADMLIREYHRQYKKIKPVTDLVRNSRDPKTPVVYNYALLRELYRYSTSVFTQHYQYRNIHQTLWDTISSLTVTPPREHFIELRLPVPLPSLAAFKLAENKFTHSQLVEFNTAEDLLILELYHWLGLSRTTSQLSSLTSDVLKKINLVVLHDHHWLLLNLGVLDSWRSISTVPDDKINPEVMQKRFLRMLISLFESTSVVNLVVPAKPTVTAPTPSTPTPSSPVLPPTGEPVGEAGPLTDEDLEADLDALRVVAIKKQESEAVGENPFTAAEPSLEQGILSRAEQLAEEGLLSAAEYRRYEKIAGLYKEIKDPYTGKGSMVEAAIVKPEEVALTPVVLQDHLGITDKSMLETTINGFASRYTDTVLKKDIMGCILNFNRAGIAVTDYDVETVVDVANAFENHTVKLTPVGGRSSTIRFKIPVVQKDGSFMSNGVKYRLRNQRAD